MMIDGLHNRKKKILFIHFVNDYGSLGIEYISASLKRAGHQTDLILHHGPEKYFASRLYNKVSAFNPDFVCFSTVTFEYLWASKVARFIKEITGAKTVFGGIHPTSCPEEIIRHPFVDYLVVGEGDEAIIDLVENPENTEIKNVWTKKNGEIIRNEVRPLLQDLDLLPFPDKELFYRDAPYLKYTYLCISGKGCPFRCSYCFNNFMRNLYHGEKWTRKRSVDNLIEELKVMKERFGYKQIEFFDDCFTVDKKWLIDFSKKYKEEINVPFKAISHPSYINRETAERLKDMGCIKLQLGAQTATEKIRRDICKRQDSNECILNAVREAKRVGIIATVDHIFGLPGETNEDYEKGLEFYIDVKPHRYITFWLQYYPNTEIIEIGKKYGTVNDELMKDVEKGRVTHGAKGIDPKTLEIARFMHFIPILPRCVSRFILRKRLYPKIFRYTFFSNIHVLVLHFYSLDLFKALVWITKRIIHRKRALSHANIDGKKMAIPQPLEHNNKELSFNTWSHYQYQTDEGVFARDKKDA
ncbi:MAG: radical SAM protein [Candidatus Omnitrophota bacterium]